MWSDADRPIVARYVIAGVWNTVFGYGAFVILLSLFASKVHYMVVAVLSNVLAITNAYGVHKLFVFKTKGRYLREYARYYAVYGASALIGLACLAALTSGLGINVYVAQAIVLGVQTVVSFRGHQRISFRPPAPDTD